MSRTFAVSLAAGLLLAVGSVAAQQSSPPPPTPGPEHARLKKLEGTWDVVMTTPDGKKSKGDASPVEEGRRESPPLGARTDSIPAEHRPAPEVVGTDVLYVGVDLGTSRSAVAGSNGVRDMVASVIGWPKDRVA